MILKGSDGAEKDIAGPGRRASPLLVQVQFHPRDTLALLEISRVKWFSCGTDAYCETDDKLPDSPETTKERV